MKKITLSLFFSVILSFAVNGQWKESDSGQESLIRNISIVDDNTVWVSDQNNTSFSYTLDNGNSWTTKDFPEIIRGYVGGLSCVNDSTAFIVANYGDKGIFKTTNFGDTWIKQSSGFNDNSPFPGFIHLFNENDGIAIGDAYPNENYEIYTTSNGGDSWNLVPDSNMPSGNYGWTYNNNNFYRVVGNSFYFITNTGNLFKSTDKGITWSEISTPVTNGGNMSFDFKDENNGIASVYDYSTRESTIYSTTDGGSNWTEQNTQKLVNVYYDATDGVYFGTHSVYGLSYSSDDGQTWTQHSTLDFYSGAIEALRVSNSGKIFIGGWGKVYTSSNYLGENPYIDTAVVVNSTTIELKFNTEVEITSAQDTANYKAYYYQDGNKINIDCSHIVQDTIDKTLVRYFANSNFPDGKFWIKTQRVNDMSGNSVISKTKGSQYIFNEGITNDLPIADSNFEQALIDLGFDKHGLNGAITETDALAIDSLDLSDPSNNSLLPNVNTKLSNLSGIEHFTNLVYLNASVNNISSVDLSSNLELLTLYLVGNQIDSIDISSNVKLERLSVAKNNLTYLDISKNTDLGMLSLYENQLTSLDLTKQTKLISAYLYDNNLSGIDISNCVQLVKIYTNNNPNLGNIDISNNLTLERLYAPNCGITSLDFSLNNNLKRLYLDDNQISSIDVSNNTNIDLLYIDGNQLSNIDISNNTILEYLAISRTQISSIDLSNNPMLKQIHANETTISDFDISSNPLLEVFNASNSNNFTTIDFSNNTVLRSIDLYNTSIATLDFSNNNSITTLRISNNSNLEALDIKNGNTSILEVFEITNNPLLTCVQVDDVAWADANLTNKDAGTAYSINCDDTWTVYTEDENFEDALASATDENGDSIDADGDGEITLEEAKAVTGTLDLGGLSIDDITGISAFENITGLILSGNNITDISGLLNGTTTAVNKTGKKESFMGGITSLETLDVSNNSIEEIDLSTITTLISLDVSSNNLMKLNIRNGSNTILTTFDTSGNPNLKCIQVDDNTVASVPVSWVKDATTNYNTDCQAALSIEDISDSDFSIYPNPVLDMITINPEKGQNILDIGIYDFSGKQILKTKKTRIDLSRLPKGIYFIEINSDKGKLNKKLIKE